MNLSTWIFGPLVGSECHRALGRGGLILVRTLASLAILTVTLIVLWYGWICISANPLYRPYRELRTGLVIVEGLLVTIALVLAPAVLAGSLAGENERGALGLLLTTRVTSREVVAGRFAGKMTQVGMILLVGLPAITLLAVLTGSDLSMIAVLSLLPATIALGGGGLATAVSATSRRGRDALLSVYLIDLVFLLGPLVGSLGITLGKLEWITVLNPYTCLGRLLWEERYEGAWLTIGIWAGLGLAGLAIATWRLAPSCLRQLDGARLGRVSRRRRRRRVPRLSNRPMVWKELYIESAGRLGGLGWWVGATLALLLGGGSLAMAGFILWGNWYEADRSLSIWATTMLSVGVSGSSMIVAWLIEWAIGLRAAVTVASERERGTWDAILTSPLESREIVYAKLWGSLYALRWLFVAASLAWTITFAAGAMPPTDYASLVASTLVTSAFMAAVGIRASLTSATATRAMTQTIGIWLGALIGFTILGAVLISIAWVFLFVALTIASGTDFSTTSVSLRSWIPVMSVVKIVVMNLPAAVATIIIVGLTSVRFDRLAGRSAGGPEAFAINRDRSTSSMPIVSPSDRPISIPPQNTTVLQSAAANSLADGDSDVPEA